MKSTINTIKHYVYLFMLIKNNQEYKGKKSKKHKKKKEEENEMALVVSLINIIKFKEVVLSRNNSNKNLKSKREIDTVSNIRLCFPKMYNKIVRYLSNFVFCGHI